MIIATLLFLGGLGAGEIFLIVFGLVLLFGAKKIPELARGVGQGIREFKDASSGIKNEIEKGINDPNNAGTKRVQE
jgi:sec-independent protein translocase protein TatA